MCVCVCDMYVCMYCIYISYTYTHITCAPRLAAENGHETKNLTTCPVCAKKFSKKSGKAQVRNDSRSLFIDSRSLCSLLLKVLLGEWQRHRWGTRERNKKNGFFLAPPITQ